MNGILNWIIAGIIAYLLGGANGSIIGSHVFFRDDIRRHGSGNAGSTNTLRTYGKKPAIFSFAFDTLKIVLAVFIGRLLGGQDCGYLCGVIGGLGHCFPVWYGFKGGKGVACAVAALFCFDFKLWCLAALLFFSIGLSTRYVSLASVTCASLLPLGTWLFRPEKPYWAVALVYCALVVWLHRSNIKRLLNGTESKLSFGEKK